MGDRFRQVQVGRNGICVMEQMSSADLQWIRTILERAFEHGLDHEEIDPEEVGRAFRSLLAALERGDVRAAEPQGHRWIVNSWVGKGIITGLRKGEELAEGEGVYIGPGVYLDSSSKPGTGAYLDEGTHVDSRVLIGSCAQVGKRVRLSTGAMLGGALGNDHILPVILEDDAYIGGGCNVLEGTIIRRRAVLAAGTILTATTPVYDLIKGNVLHSRDNNPLEIPEGAVVVPGARKVENEWAAVHGLSQQCPLIIGYREEESDPLSALTKAFT